MELYETLPIVPLRDVVVFPHMMMPFVIGRPSSTRALEHALGKDKRIFLAAQHDAQTDEPQPADIYTMGCVANIVQSLKLPDGNIKVLVEGIERARAVEWKEDKGFYRVVVKIVPKHKETGVDAESTMSKVVALFEQYVKLSNNLNYDAMIAAVRVDDPGKLADTIAAHLVVGVDEKQNLLEIISPIERLNRIIGLLEAEVDKLQVDRRIQSRVKKQMEKAQKEYYLNEKMKAIQKELGRKDEKGNEVDELKKKIETSKMPKDVEEKAIQELKRLEAMPPMSAEATVSRNYLDWLIAVPWHKKTRESRDLARAEEILNEDHYGLEKIKERILEFLAVRALVKKPKATILTFSGPPGVGKTSLAKSIARAMNRKFVRLSLGGVRDEAEIRGHRRTYIGALPGQVIQMMKKAGTRNPVVMLDEIDKMSMDFRGDPSAALLEVLDPEQNYMFMDHYLDVEYDLREVFFIATANVLHTIPSALQDRMEVIRLSGYTELEKLEIARRFLVSKQRKDTGVTGAQVEFPDAGLQALIQSYTREAGVRNLEREIGNLCRKVARKVVEAQSPVTEDLAENGEPIEVIEEEAAPIEEAPGKKGKKKIKKVEEPALVAIEKVVITRETVESMLGPAKFRDIDLDKQNEIGATTGLAWTEVGGSILTTEAMVMEGRGKLTTTGKLGDVMQESAQAAMSYVRSRAQYLGLPKDFYRHLDIHVHVPEGAIPKDGPSAGITIATSICSALTAIPVRCDLAMTGEITVRGRVLPIGGLKEKLLAAHRQGLFEVVLPRDNEKDLVDIPENVRKEMKLHFVFTMDEVLKIALERELVALPLAPPTTELAQRSGEDNLMH
jgi:ATP-dependent Lon protease